MLKFGTAGVPLSIKSRKVEDGVRECARLGLGAMEVEFVRGVKMSREQAARVRQARDDTGLSLTAHGPYYINLCSLDPAIKSASVERVMESARRADWMGAESVTFHAGFYQGRDSEAVYEELKAAFAGIVAQMDKEGLSPRLSPELTGKATQFGSLGELIRLAADLPSVSLCIDFAHLVARAAGDGNDQKNFSKALLEIESGLGRSALRNLHMHVSGIEWTPKGERRHQPLSESTFKYRDLLRALVEHEVAGVVICESPLLEEDARLLQKEYAALAKKRPSGGKDKGK